MTKIFNRLAALSVLLLGLFALHIFKTIYDADVAYKLSQQSLERGQLSFGLEYINDALKKNPMEPNYYKGRARIYIASLSNRDSKVALQLKTKALEDLNYAYNLNPSNLVTMRNLVPLYYFLSVKNLSIAASSTNVDPQFLPYAQGFFKHVATVSPNDVGVYVLLAKYEKRLDLIQDYIASIDKIKFPRPDLLDWYSDLK